MEIDFHKKLQTIFAKYPKARLCKKDLKGLIQNMAIHNWTIYKRSLPIGVNQPIVFNLTEHEAVKWLQRLKTKLVAYDTDEDIRVIYYYEKVRSDGYLAGIYENDKQITKDPLCQ